MKPKGPLPAGHSSAAATSAVRFRRRIPPEITDLSIDPFTAGDSSVRLVRPAHVSPRIAAQLGVLTIHRKPDEDCDTPELHKWIIPEKLTFTLKGMLAFCGLHSASMFPDSVDRHAQYVAWRHKWERLS